MLYYEVFNPITLLYLIKPCLVWQRVNFITNINSNLSLLLAYGKLNYLYHITNGN